MDQTQDRSLVADVLTGDTEAFSRLVRKYQHFAYGVAVGVVPDFDLAQDAVQEAFLAAYRDLHRLSDAERFAGWLRAIVRNCALRILRDRKQVFQWVEEFSEATEPVLDAPSMDQVLVESERRDLVRQALERLGSKNREAVSLYYVDGLSYAEIADLIGVTEATVKGRIQRGRARMREGLQMAGDVSSESMVQGVFDEHKLPVDFSRNVWNLEYNVRGFGELLAMRACLIQSGVDVEWEDLLAYSGDAFSCDGMAYFSVRGHDVLTHASRAYGFQGRWGLGVEEAGPDLRACLARKQPCIAPGFDGWCLWWVAVLEANPKRNQFLVAGGGTDPKWLAGAAGDATALEWIGQCPWAEGAHVYPDGVPANWQLCPRFLLGDRGSPPSPAARLRDTLQLAIAVHRREEFAYHWGCEAGAAQLETHPIGRGYLKQWPGFLREWSELRGWSQAGDQEPLDDCDPDPPPCYRDSYFAAVAHGMRRRAAAAFLRHHLNDAASKSRPMLESAAKHYERSAAASGRILDAICGAACVQRLDWYRRLQVGANYIGERDESGVAEAEAYAKQHPDRWVARQAILRSLNKCLQDRGRVDEACQAAQLVLHEDDAAVEDIEKALAAG